MRSADEAETLAYSMLNNIPVLPEVIVSGPQQQKYLRVADEAPSSSVAGSGRGQKRENSRSEFASKDKTGRSARSAPKTPGALEGDVMMADVETKGQGDSLTLVQSEFMLSQGSVTTIPSTRPVPRAKCIKAQGAEDLHGCFVKDCEVVLGNSSQVESYRHAWTGFTFFKRA